mmetsp:Transcript_6431/g.15964  ORF Transcript_6431/g.15964 Transcript_6431/m.15964 type:complete len:205 (+) Transcript_6431:370-984(+)
MRVMVERGALRMKYTGKPDHNFRGPPVETILRAQSIGPLYGILPAASGFIFCICVFTKSKGKEKKAPKNPPIAAAPNTWVLPPGSQPIAASCCFACVLKVSIPKFKAMARVAVGTAPVSRPVAPSVFTIEPSAWKTFRYPRLSAAGKRASDCIRIRDKSAGLPTTAAIPPAPRAHKADFQNGSGWPGDETDAVKTSYRLKREPV